MAGDEGSVVVVGGTTGIGKEVARHYAEQGRPVFLTGRDAQRAQSVAEEIGGETTGLALELEEPHAIAERLSPVGPAQYLVIAAMQRDANSVRDYSIDRAIGLVTQKLVGYTAVVHALLPRMSDDSSIVLFGGLAKDRPYPGSTTVTTVNGGIFALVKTMAVEIAPIRVNAIHPGIVADSPYWKDNKEFLASVRQTMPAGRDLTMADMVYGTVFLLENQAANAMNLHLDGAWGLMT